MNTKPEHNSFIFNEKIDSDFIFSLYEDDFTYIEEIFGITLAQLLPDISQIVAAHKSKDREDLRKAVHKIKPSFGFVGLLASQESCKKFEALCNPDTPDENLEVSYSQLLAILDESQKIVTEEYKRIKEYNLSIP